MPKESSTLKIAFCHLPVNGIWSSWELDDCPTCGPEIPRLERRFCRVGDCATGKDMEEKENGICEVWDFCEIIT
jgi:hypothetical protein